MTDAASLPPSALLEKVPPRIYCIPATRAPIVAVFLRGPSRWSQVGRWDLETLHYEPGAWLGGRIFPRRSDLSPDGRFLCYFAHKPSATWEHGEAYVALSKLPWLHALHAFGTCGTWTRGYFFSETATSEQPEGAALPIPYGLRANPAMQFANERRRGWEESPDSPVRSPFDMWDERRNARMQKRQPHGNRVLCVESRGRAGGEFGIAQAVDGMRVGYWLEDDDSIQLLDDLQWADWNSDGRLLVATRSGKLELRRLDEAQHETQWEIDLSSAEPNPEPAPAWAHQW